MVVSKCCCCIKVKTAVNLIGAWHVLLLIGGLFEIQPVRVSLELFTAIAFIVMLFKDSAATRQFFFATYCVFCVCYNAIFMVKCYEAFQKQSEFKAMCMDPKTLRQYKTSSVDECTARLLKTVEGEIFVFVVIHAIVQVHFCYVLYAHWKNSGLDKSEGGTVEASSNAGVIDDVQMRAIE